MGFLDKLFGGGKKAEAASHQLPSDVVASEFGEVNVRRTREATEVLFTILMEPTGTEAEGWQTGMAMDASASMMGSYGQGLLPGPKGNPPEWLLREYAGKGWIGVVDRDGAQHVMWTEQAAEDAVRRGHLAHSPNEVQSLVREMAGYLAGTLDADGQTTIIYWACDKGDSYEVLGDFAEEQCTSIEVTGPKEVAFGNGTCLLPAVKYFVERFADAKRGMYIFVTDGALDDLAKVKSYTKRLCQEIAAKKRNPVKCVLIGVGSQIDEDQMEELDDLESGTDVDIWDHKIAKEMRAMKEIFAEVVSENQIVAPTATIYDDQGNVAARFADGLPAKVSFKMSPTANAFELDVAGRRIRQTLLSRKA
jgi:hypothetical protein